jgi:peroxiredoxin Q/BCP
MLEPGDKAPDFKLPDQNGDLIKLSDVLDRTLVLFFYPRADTVINNKLSRSASGFAA